MSSRRRLGLAAAIFWIAAVPGCGFGEGEERGSAELRVTRDYGTDLLLDRVEHGLPDSETVLRLLENGADITTRYGGRFVQSIEGTESTASGERRFDWFFYVNGVESPTGAADVSVRDGDRIWWDYREWTDVMRVPAVVGSWPEPFAHGFEGDTYTTRIDCLEVRSACRDVEESLEEQDVEAGIFEDEQAPGYDAEAQPTLRIIVGTWAKVRKDRAAAQIDRGPQESGVFARFEPGPDGFTLLGLGRDGEEVVTFAPRTGLDAHVRLEETPPTWVVTGSDRAGVEAAAAALTEDELRDRYAVVVEPGKKAVPVPISVAR